MPLPIHPNLSRLISATLLITASSTASAQTILLDDIVVSASRTEQRKASVGSSVQVIERKELEKHSQTYVKDYLEKLPGVSFYQSGGAGAQSGIRIRGAHQKYIKVLVDGIDISDPSSPQIATRYEHLLTDDIERIEVLKGSQSTLYGSEAIGGVISITSRTAEKNGYSLRAKFEAGQYNTKKGGVGFGYKGDKGEIALNVGAVKTDGFSAADENEGNTEKDGYKNLTFSGRGSYNLAENVGIFFAARSVRSNLDYDNGYPVVDHIGNEEDFRQQAFRIGANISLLDGAFKNKISYQKMNLTRDDTRYVSFLGAFSDSKFEAERDKIEYLGTYTASKQLQFVFGADREETTAKPNTPETYEMDMSGVFAQMVLTPFDSLNVTVGGRSDHHSEFGKFNTYRASASWSATNNTRFYGSYGTGFRAPSLYELNGPFVGNADLQPEESKSWDIGVEQKLLNDKFSVSATYFNLETENLIGYTTSYANVPGITKRRGFEFLAQGEFTTWMDASLAYTFTDTKGASGDFETVSNGKLGFVPHHVWTIGTTIKPTDKISWTTTAQIVRETYAASFGTDPIKLDDYILLNSKVDYKFNENVTAYIRGVNLLNQEYQTINEFGSAERGYGTSDRAFYAGVRIKLHAE